MKRLKVKTSYRAEFVGKEYKKAMKINPELPKVIEVDHNDRDEVLYMFGVYLTDPGVRLYIKYNDGSMKRIKTHYCLFRNIWNEIRRFFKYGKRDH